MSKANELAEMLMTWRNLHLVFDHKLKAIYAPKYTSDKDELAQAVTAMIDERIVIHGGELQEIVTSLDRDNTAMRNLIAILMRKVEALEKNLCTAEYDIRMLNTSEDSPDEQVSEAGDE